VRVVADEIVQLLKEPVAYWSMPHWAGLCKSAEWL
jgi:hypothetical protein